jgi:hypothetical protein
VIIKNPIIQKISNFLHFFDFFKFFFKKKLKINVCLNLITKTSKYRLEPTFLSVFHLLSFEPTFEKIEALFFSEIFFENEQKIIFRVLAGNCVKSSIISFKNVLGDT